MDPPNFGNGYAPQIANVDFMCDSASQYRHELLHYDFIYNFVSVISLPFRTVVTDGHFQAPTPLINVITLRHFSKVDSFRSVEWYTCMTSSSHVITGIK